LDVRCNKKDLNTIKNAISTMISKYLTTNISLFAFIFYCGLIGCQKEANESSVSETGLCLVLVDGKFEEIELDEKPQYINGGQEGFYHNIYEEITYPAEARENHIQGTCLCNYEITEFGTVENIVITQDPGGGIGNEVIRTIEIVTDGISFEPGIYNGNPVRVKKGLSILFKLQ
jgi:hypothetical protein